MVPRGSDSSLAPSRYEAKHFPHVHGSSARGIGVMLRSQRNAWIHALATVTVCVMGFLFGLSRADWCWIVLAVVAVWTAEALNTALEFLTDIASPTFHPIAGKAKDVAAGAVTKTFAMSIGETSDDSQKEFANASPRKCVPANRRDAVPPDAELQFVRAYHAQPGSPVSVAERWR
jgi:diacylglycerol kinase